MQSKIGFYLLVLLLIDFANAQNPNAISSKSETPLTHTTHSITDTGVFNVYKGKSRNTIGAPHGSYDKNTDQIVTRLSALTGWNAIVATGFRTKNKPYNVNRPTEGVGLKPSNEIETKEAMNVYLEYIKHLTSLTSGMPKTYIEIHGHNNSKVLNKIEIATVGISSNEAQKIKNIFQKNISNNENLKDITVAIQGVDKIHYGAGGTKKNGTLSKTPLALHIELPRILRFTYMDETIDVLSKTILEIPTVLDSISD